MKIKSPIGFLALWSAFLAAGTWLLPVAAVFAAAPSARAATHEYADADSIPTAIMEPVGEVALLPVRQVADEPESRYSIVIVLSSEAVPGQWRPEPVAVPIGTAGTVGVGSMQFDVDLSVVSAAFVDEVGASVRFGYGLQSKVTVAIQSPATNGAREAEAFKLIAETPSSSAAIEGAEGVWSRLAQTSPPAPSAGGAGFPYYSTCVSLCLQNAHAQWWAVLLDCGVMIGVTDIAAASACVLACRLAGNAAFYPCATGCFVGIGEPVAVLSIMAFVSCLASYVAAMTVAVGVCSIGCIW